MVRLKLVERGEDEVSWWKQEIDLPAGVRAYGAEGRIPVVMGEGVVVFGGGFRVC